jgi:DinB superfamily
MIDFSQVESGELKLADVAVGLTRTELRAATHESMQTLSEIIQRASDVMIAFVPHDTDAHDPHAAPEEQNIGWTLGHLVAHVTATSEESAAISSALARGVPYPADLRLRYETPWREIDTQAKALRRLHESLKMRLGYLETWPDVPHLDNLRQLSESAQTRWGDLNAVSTFLLGLKHEVGHYDQFREVLRQAQAAEAIPTRAG